LIEGRSLDGAVTGLLGGSLFIEGRSLEGGPGLGRFSGVDGL
jgi:hypothetical protein